MLFSISYAITFYQVFLPTMNFEFQLTTRIIFEAGNFNKLASLPETNGKRCMLLRFRRCQMDAVQQQLQEHCATLLVPNLYEENPGKKMARQLGIMAADNEIETIIAVGGGSAIDLAKAAAWFAKNPAWKLSGENAPGVAPDIAIVAVPTTSGAGSEVSPYSIITDEGNFKRILKHDRLVPSVALCDPELTLSLPAHVTAHSGIDALSHLIEGYLTRSCVSILADIARTSLDKGIAALPDVLAESNSIEARSQMMETALGGGIVLAHCGTVMAHALGYALTREYGYAHGLANAIFLAALVEVLAAKGCPRAKHISAAFEDRMSDYIREHVPIPTLPAIDEAKIEEWAALGYASYGRHNANVEITLEDLRTLITQSWSTYA